MGAEALRGWNGVAAAARRLHAPAVWAKVALAAASAGRRPEGLGAGSLCGGEGCAWGWDEVAPLGARFHGVAENAEGLLAVGPARGRARGPGSSGVAAGGSKWSGVATTPRCDGQ